MSLSNSYFSIPNPLHVMDKWLHPQLYREIVSYNGKSLQLSWSKRAHRELKKRDRPLIIEMQIYFSCVVQKRVLFHEHTDLPTQAVNDDIRIILRPVEAASCNPIEFANKHPVSHTYTSLAAKSFHVRKVELDFKNRHWSCTFSI